MKTTFKHRKETAQDISKHSIARPHVRLLQRGVTEQAKTDIHVCLDWQKAKKQLSNIQLEPRTQVKGGRNILYLSIRYQLPFLYDYQSYSYTIINRTCIRLLIVLTRITYYLSCLWHWHRVKTQLLRIAMLYAQKDSVTWSRTKRSPHTPPLHILPAGQHKRNVSLPLHSAQMFSQQSSHDRPANGLRKAMCLSVASSSFPSSHLTYSPAGDSRFNSLSRL